MTNPSITWLAVTWPFCSRSASIVTRKSHEKEFIWDAFCCLQDWLTFEAKDFVVFEMQSSVLVLLCLVSASLAWTPRFFRGRPRGGFLPPPLRKPHMLGKPVSPDLWYTQTLNHFDLADNRTFQQVSRTTATTKNVL
jgi:hypothetical protein